MGCLLANLSVPKLQVATGGCKEICEEMYGALARVVPGEGVSKDLQTLHHQVNIRNQKIDELLGVVDVYQKHIDRLNDEIKAMGY